MPLVVVVGGSVIEVTSMPVETMADVVISTDEMTSVNVQISDATISLAGVVVSTTTVQPSFASKIIVPSTTHDTFRPGLSKVLLSHLQFPASGSSCQGFHDSHRDDLLSTQ